MYCGAPQVRSRVALAARGRRLEPEIDVSGCGLLQFGIFKVYQVISRFQSLPEAMDQVDDSKKVGNCEVLKASRCPFTDHQAQHQTQIETGDVDEEPLENVLTTSEVHTSHSTGFVAVGEWPFQHQPSPPQ